MNVLDASAVIAWLQDEPGSEKVPLVGSTLNLVNYVEVVGKLTREGKATDQLAYELELLGVMLSPLTLAQAQRAGEMISKTRHLGLSLGDRVCIATAELSGATAVTADKAWAELEEVSIELIR